MRTVIITLIVLVVVLSAAPLSLVPSTWITTDVVNGQYEAAPAPIAYLDGWSVDFPDSTSGKFLARVQQAQKKRTAISGTLTLTFRMVTTGLPQFLYNSEAYNTCTYPANVRPHFYIAKQIGNIYGWWGHPNPDLYPNPLFIETNLNNTTTVSISLTPSQWSNNVGQQGDLDATTMQAFQKSLGNVSEIGVSIGGGCFYGHGVNVSGGTAQLQVLGYSIQ